MKNKLNIKDVGKKLMWVGVKMEFLRYETENAILTK